MRQDPRAIEILQRIFDRPPPRLFDADSHVKTAAEAYADAAVCRHRAVSTRSDSAGRRPASATPPVGHVLPVAAAVELEPSRKRLGDEQSDIRQQVVGFGVLIRIADISSRSEIEASSVRRATS